MANFEFINLVGVEIEGRWDEWPEYGIPEAQARRDEDGRPIREGLMYDGSVEIEGESGHGNLGHPVERAGPKIGEAVSEPLPPERAVKWLESQYPDEVNQTCGLHVHFSFKPPHYQRLMDQEFWEFFLDRAFKWGENNPVPDRYFNRLNGNNNTCRRRWHPDEQVLGGHDTRYSIWNFHAFRSHGTTECRLMPAFEEVALAKEAVLFLCRCTCEFLSTYNPEPVIFTANPDPLKTTEEVI